MPPLRRVLGLLDRQPADRPGRSRSRRCRWRPPTPRSPTAAILRTPHIVASVGGERVAEPAGSRVISRRRPPRAARRCSRACSAPGGTACEVAIPGYELAGKTGTANKVDPRPASTRSTRYVASFVGFAPAQRPEAARRRVVDEPQGAIYGGEVAAPAFAEDRRASRCRTCGSRRAEARSRPRRARRLGSRDACCRERRWARCARRADVEITALAYDNRDGRRRGRCSSASRASRATATTSPPTRSRAARSALVVERPLGLGVPEVVVRRRCAPRWRPLAARFYGDPTRGAARRRRSPAPTARRRPRSSSRALLEAAGRAVRAARHRQVGRRRARAPGGAHDARGDRPAARPSRAMLDARRPRLRDGGLLARARAAAAPTAIHFAAAIFTNLTQDHLDFHPTMEDYFAAKRRLFEARRRGVARRQRRRPLRPRGSRPSCPRRASRSRIDAPTPTTARATLRSASPARRFVARHAGRASSSSRSPLPGRFNVANVLGALAAAQRARRRRSTTIAAALPRGRAACPAASSRSTRASRSRCSSTTRTRPTRSRTCCAPRATLTDGPRCSCVFGCGGDRDRGKRPLMGADRARARRRRDRHLRQPALRGPRGDHRARSSPGSSRRRRVERRGRPPRGDRARDRGAPSAGDVVVIAGKGHEQGQEFAGGRKIPFDDVDGRARGAARSRVRLDA